MKCSSFPEDFWSGQSLASTGSWGLSNRPVSILIVKDERRIFAKNCFWIKVMGFSRYVWVVPKFLKVLKVRNLGMNKNLALRSTFCFTNMLCLKLSMVDLEVEPSKKDIILCVSKIVLIYLYHVLNPNSSEICLSQEIICFVNLASFMSEILKNWLTILI